MPTRSEVVPPTSAETQQTLQAIEAKLRTASRIQVMGHHRPDGDCYGSLLAMHAILEALGKDHRLAAADQGRNGYATLGEISRVQSSPDSSFHPDLFIFLDSATLERTLPDWKPAVPSINIDHHASNSLYAGINWVDPRRASTAEMVYELALHLKVPVEKPLAEAVLLGIMTDTGSFRYANVGPRQFEICAELLRAGADVARISRAAYESRSPETVAVIAAVLASVRYLADGRLAYAEVRADTVRRVGGAQNLPENLSAELRSIQGVRASLLFVELPDEAGLRLSLRADGAVNVSRLAALFGGGGHPNAAGISLKDVPYEETRDKILAAAEQAVRAETPLPGKAEQAQQPAD
jgi:bifunctional oligoribonuclease and PAP phosphatase NrnA